MGKIKQNKQNTVAAAKEIVENIKAPEEESISLVEDSSVSTYLWLLVFSVLMFTFPFMTYYGVRSWLQESYDFTVFQTNCFSVLAAVLVVNSIICLYVYKAFRETEKSSKQDVDKEN